MTAERGMSRKPCLNARRSYSWIFLVIMTGVFSSDAQSPSATLAEVAARVSACASNKQRHCGLAALEDLLLSFPDDGSWLEGLRSHAHLVDAAEALRTLDRPFEALDLLERSGVRNPSRLKGELLLEVGLFEQAEATFQSAWEAGDRMALDRLVGVVFARGDVGRAWELRRLSKPVEEGSPAGSKLPPLLWLCEREAAYLSGLPYGRPTLNCTTHVPPHSCCPDAPSSHIRISHLLAMTFLDEIGAFKESLIYQQAALTLCPSFALQVRGTLATPSAYASIEEMLEWRGVTNDAVERVELAPLPSRSPMEAAEHLQFSSTPPTMMIGYQGLSDHLLLGRIATLHTRVEPSLLSPSLPPPPLPPPPTHNKLHVGFASSFLWSHSVGRLLTGVITTLDRTRFAVHILHVSHTPSADDPVAAALSTRADSEHTLPPNLSHAADLILSLHLDVLVYPELGMDTRAYALAFRRLAPVQAVFWGHPVSQGIPSIDYFLSSELYEDFSAWGEERYDEQRVMMEGLTTRFSNPSVNGGAVVGRGSRAEKLSRWGLPPDAHVYLLCQTIMKLHPGLDAPLREILSRDERGYVVITYSMNQRLWRARVERRMRGVLGRVLSYRLVFIPTLPKQEFYQLLAEADVFLDPFPFGGGVTALEALAAGAVLVTLPSEQTVVRLAAGFYRHMDLDDLIMQNEDEYVAMAVAVACNETLRDVYRSRIAERMHLLYDDAQATAEWERTLWNLGMSSRV